MTNFTMRLNDEQLEHWRLAHLEYIAQSRRPIAFSAFLKVMIDAGIADKVGMTRSEPSQRV